MAELARFLARAALSIMKAMRCSIRCGRRLATVHPESALSLPAELFHKEKPLPLFTRQ